jgi:hypothetical protein
MKRDFIYIAIVIILGLLYFRSCERQTQKESNAQHNAEVLNDTVQYYTNKLGQEVAEKKAFKGEKKKLLQIINQQENENTQLKEALRKFPKVSTATQIITETKIDTIKIPFKDSIPCNFYRAFEKREKFYAISGDINNQSITFNNITIPNEQSVIIGKKNTGFLKNEFRVEVTNSNPLIKVKEVNAYDFTVPKKRFGIGVIGGYWTCNKKLDKKIRVLSC